MKVIKPVMAALIFLATTLYTSYFLKTTNTVILFFTAPFNIIAEQAPLYNILAPTLLIFIVAFYLKNFNEAFERKCSLRSIYIIALIANYTELSISLAYYHGLSYGTSIITVSFIIAFLISLELYVFEKEKVSHIYPHFLFSILASLVIILISLTILAFFINSSALVNAIGVFSFIFIFMTYYERDNIVRFITEEERKIEEIEQSLIPKIRNRVRGTTLGKRTRAAK